MTSTFRWKLIIKVGVGQLSGLIPHALLSYHDQHEDHSCGYHMSSASCGCIHCGFMNSYNQNSPDLMCHTSPYYSAIPGLNNLHPDVFPAHIISNTTLSSCDPVPTAFTHSQLNDSGVHIAVILSHHNSQGLSVVITPGGSNHDNDNDGPSSPLSDWGPSQKAK